MLTPETAALLYAVNRAVIGLRGAYRAWSALHGISYHEMLVLYTIREYGFCTQKRICESYLLPRQTINNVIARMREAGLLAHSRADSCGREKAFVLTESGRQYAAPLLASMDAVEMRAVSRLSEEKLREMTRLVLEYDEALAAALEED